MNVNNMHKHKLSCILIIVSLLTIKASIEEMSIAQVSEIQERTVSDSDVLSEVEIKAFGKIYKLILIKDSPIFAPSLIEGIITANSNGNAIIKQAKIYKIHDDMQEHFFTDETGQAALHVQKKNGIIHLEGIVTDGIRIEPTSSKPLFGVSIHFVYKQYSDRNFKEPNAFQSKIINNLHVKNIETPMNIETRSLPIQVTPEVLLVLDYKMSSYFKFKMDRIKKYLGIFFSSVNRRFETIPWPHIRFVVTGILIKKIKRTDEFITTVSPGVVNIRKTMDKFGKWIHKKRHLIKAKYDIALWITGLQMGRWEKAEHRIRKDTTGISYVGHVCRVIHGQNYNVGMVEDNPGKYTGIHTATHELAHILGASHDGESINSPPGTPGASQCPWEDGYIMSYEHGTTNKFFFSECSIRQIRHVLQSHYASCLLDRPAQAEVQFNSRLPGQIISLDNQCRSLHGKQHFFHRPMLSEVCVKMWCAHKQNRKKQFRLMAIGPALEGSYCGRGLICLDGGCLPLNRAFDGD